MALITQSRHDALVAALKAVRDAEPGDTDTAYDLLATQLLALIPAFSSGAGAPTDGIPVLSKDGDLYFDTVAHTLYFYQAGWHAA